MNEDGRAVTAKFPAEIVAQMDEVADRIDRSKSWILRQAVSEWLAEEQRRYELTLEALKSVDEGRTFTQEEVEEHLAARREARGASACGRCRVSIRWSSEARDDADRLADFVAASDPVRAGEIEQQLNQAPKKPLHFRRRGSRLSEFDPREVREFRSAGCRLRDALVGTGIFVGTGSVAPSGLA